jgi:hypothetical protein
MCALCRAQHSPPFLVQRHPLFRHRHSHLSRAGTRGPRADGELDAHNGLYRSTLDPSRFAFLFFDDDGHRGDDNDQNDLALVLTERAIVQRPESLVLLNLGLVAMALVRRWHAGN